MRNLPSSPVLIIDDKESNRRSIKRILEPLDNIECIEADSGDTALRILLKRKVAIILLDINMPGLTGYEVAQIITSDSDLADIPIIMITARGSSAHEVRKAYEAGATDYISKPIEPIVLVNKVKLSVALHQSSLYNEWLIEQRERVLNAAGEGVIELDAAGCIQYCNAKAEYLLGVLSDGIIGSRFEQWFHPRESDISEVSVNSFKALVHQVDTRGLHQQIGFNAVSQSGQAYPVEITCTGSTNRGEKMITLLFQDISERLEMERRLLAMANYDPLTGLANRAYFHSILEKSLKRRPQQGHFIALLFIDLDHFKYVNDNYGHDVGDELLKVASLRLQQSVREGDLVARMGGDEFAIVLYDVDSTDSAVIVVEKILEKISQPIQINGNEISSSVSIGVALQDDEQSDVLWILKAADTAMYEAKAEGRNNYRFFAQQMQESANKKQRIQVMLHQAIPNQQFKLVYQPKISLSKNAIVGCEALLRWVALDDTKQAALISPGVFIPIAEESGQILSIGDWVLDNACQQLYQWFQYPAMRSLSTSINVSTRQLRHGEFAMRVAKCLEHYRIPPHQLELEITETGVVDDLGEVISQLQQLHQLGVKLSIDDFGTGNSSLDHLRKLPFDLLKIDQSFIQDIGVDPQDEDIIRAIMAVAKTMGLSVVAEGVERIEQLVFMDSEACDLIQGYYFSQPLSPEEFFNLMIEKNDSPFSGQFAEIQQFMGFKTTKVL